MKSTSLLKQNSAVKLTAKPAHSQIGSDSLEKKFDKLMQMFTMQMECNYELIKRLDHSHQPVIHENQIANAVPATEKTSITPLVSLPVVKKEETVLTPLTYDKLILLTPYFTFSIENAPRRTAAVHSLINILHVIYQFGGETFVEQIFACENLVPVTGYRYLHRLRKEKLITFSGRFTGCAYVLTPAGRKFIEGQIRNKEQMQAALADQNI